MVAALAGCLVGVLIRPASGQPASFMGRIEALLISEARDCHVGHVATGVVSTQSFQGYSEYVVLWISSTEGCGGGNNWGTGASAFYVRQPVRGVASIKRIPLDRPVLETTSFSFVKSVAFANDPQPAKSGASTRSVEIIGLQVGEGDARCCPTDVRHIKLWIDDGRFRVTQIRQWKEKSE